MADGRGASVFMTCKGVHWENLLAKLMCTMQCFFGGLLRLFETVLFCAVVGLGLAGGMESRQQQYSLG